MRFRRCPPQPPRGRNTLLWKERGGDGANDYVIISLRFRLVPKRTDVLLLWFRNFFVKLSVLTTGAANPCASAQGETGKHAGLRKNKD